MNEMIFHITTDQKQQFEEILIPFDRDIIVNKNRTTTGFKITINALGGKQQRVSELANLLKSSGFD